MPSQNDSKKVKHNIIVGCQDFPEKKRRLNRDWFLNKDDGHIRLLIMNNKSSCQRRSILSSVHSTETVPHFSNHHCYSARVHQELLIWPKIILTKSGKTTSSWLILLPSIQFRNSEIILNAVSASHGLEKC